MRILVAMSGGIDSAVAALLLKREGHEVVGMTMRVHDAPERFTRERSCCAPRDMRDAREVASCIGIPYYAVDMREEFHERVIKPFAADYVRGRTPSPCVLCNSEFKFGLLHQRAKALGFEAVATGHYARSVKDPQTGAVRLLRARDQHKDQSYFLFAMSQEQLACALFPLGEWTKPEVRELARQANLPIAEKPESQEICFVSEGNYASVVEETFPDEIAARTQQPAEIRDEQGMLLGTHKGLHHYTVGQRRKIGVSSAQPLYVTGLDVEQNRLRVGQEPSLYRRELQVERVNWLNPAAAETTGMRAHVAIRYRHQAAPAHLHRLEGGQLRVEFDEAQRAISPGQAAVFYQHDEVLGGGWIAP